MNPAYARRANRDLWQTPGHSVVGGKGNTDWGANEPGFSEERRDAVAIGEGTKEHPWELKTPPLTSAYQMYLDEKDGTAVIMCVVGKTTLIYDQRAIADLHSMLRQCGDWVELGSADEQKPAKEGTVEAWGRSESNPVGGWYGLKKGLRGRFGMYMPPLLEALELAEVEHNSRGNRMRAR